MPAKSNTSKTTKGATDSNKQGPNAALGTAAATPGKTSTPKKGGAAASIAAAKKTAAAKTMGRDKATGGSARTATRGKK
jgi:hypothetical protein